MTLNMSNRYQIKRELPVISVFFGFINWPIIDMISCPPWKSKSHLITISLLCKKKYLDLEELINIDISILLSFHKNTCGLALAISKS